MKKAYTQPFAILIDVDMTVDTAGTSGGDVPVQTDEGGWGGFHPMG